MKAMRITRIVITMAIVALAGTAIYAFADGGDDGYGLCFGRSGYGMMGPGYGMMGWTDAGDAGPGLNKADAEKRDALREKFQEETVPLQRKIYQKSLAFRSELAKDEPDAEALKDLQKEISALQANMDQLRLAYRLEMRKIFPNGGIRYGHGSGSYPEQRRGGYMMRGGSGPGGCWR